jgi:hypothetical protein
MHEAPLTCPHCAAPLDALSRQQRSAHCGAAACRHRAAARVLEARWDVVARMAVQRAADASVKAGGPAAVLWLRPANRELETVSDALRQALAKAWRQGVADGWRHAYPGTDSAQVLPADATVLCAQCGGRCCAHGAGHHAFVDVDLLDRWQAEHPGSTTEDAIADYLARLPAVHVQGGCGFQTATGCALPRERRADVCKRYACNALSDLGELLQQDPERAAVVLTSDGNCLERAALLRQGRTTPLTGLPQPDDIPRPER